MTLRGGRVHATEGTISRLRQGTNNVFCAAKNLEPPISQLGQNAKNSHRGYLVRSSKADVRADVPVGRVVPEAVFGHVANAPTMVLTGIKKRLPSGVSGWSTSLPSHKQAIRRTGSKSLALLQLCLLSWSLFHSERRSERLVQAGKLRIGVFPSFQYSKDLATGQAHGLAIEIANAFSSRIGVGEVVTVEYPTPPQVIACVRTGGCE